MATPETALSVLPEVAKAGLAKLPANLQQRLEQYASPEMLAVLEVAETPEEAAEMLEAIANSINADTAAPPQLPVYTIQHQTQPGVPKKWLDSEGNTAGDTLYAVVLVWGPMRGLFVEGEKAPLCSAKGAGMGRGKASADADKVLQAWATKAQLIIEHKIDWAGQERSCEKCPFNQFGSHLKGRKGKACPEKDTFLFVLVKKNPDGSFEVTDEGYGAKIPTTSGKLWDTFIEKALRQRKVAGKRAPLSSLQVITALKLTTGESDVNSFGIVNPELARPLTPEEFKRVYRMQKDALRMFEAMGVEYGENYGEATEGDEALIGAGTGENTTVITDPNDPNYVPF